MRKLWLNFVKLNLQICRTNEIYAHKNQSFREWFRFIFKLSSHWWYYLLKVDWNVCVQIQSQAKSKWEYRHLNCANVNFTTIWKWVWCKINSVWCVRFSYEFSELRILNDNKNSVELNQNNDILSNNRTQMTFKSVLKPIFLFLFFENCTFFSRC